MSQKQETSIKDVNKEAFKQAEKELLVEKVKEVKSLILETLRKTEDKKKEKVRLDEELRILKSDLEDLRNGRFEKIQERREKSKVAKNISVDIEKVFPTHPETVCSNNFLDCRGVDSSNITSPLQSTPWLELTAGCYVLENNKNFYL